MSKFYESVLERCRSVNFSKNRVCEFISHLNNSHNSHISDLITLALYINYASLRGLSNKIFTLVPLEICKIFYK